MSPPTLPGDIVGLLRRGSPVIKPGTPGWTGVIHRAPAPSDDLTDLHLDLSDPTGRAHAAWWLARAWGARMPSVAQRLRHTPPESTTWLCGAEGWLLSDLGETAYWGPPGPRRGWHVGIGPRVLPELAGLDLRDDTRLLDGSRWVDAEALRRACLAVAGR